MLKIALVSLSLLVLNHRTDNGGLTLVVAGVVALEAVAVPGARLD